MNEDIKVDEKTGNKTSTFQPRVLYAGGCQHYYVQDGEKDPNTGLTSYKCNTCPSGILLPSEYEVVDGKMELKNV